VLDEACAGLVSSADVQQTYPSPYSALQSDAVQAPWANTARNFAVRALLHTYGFRACTKAKVRRRANSSERLMTRC
jgi:hypothetical protein